MKTKSTLGLGVIVVFSIVVAVASSIDTTPNAYAQNTTTGTNQTADPQQIKKII